MTQAKIKPLPTSIGLLDRHRLLQNALLSRSLTVRQYTLLMLIVETYWNEWGCSKHTLQWYADEIGTQPSHVHSDLQILEEKKWVTVIRSNTFDRTMKQIPNWGRAKPLKFGKSAPTIKPKDQTETENRENGISTGREDASSIREGKSYIDRSPATPPPTKLSYLAPADATRPGRESLSVDRRAVAKAEDRPKPASGEDLPRPDPEPQQESGSGSESKTESEAQTTDQDIQLPPGLMPVPGSTDYYIFQGAIRHKERILQILKEEQGHKQNRIIFLSERRVPLPGENGSERTNKHGRSPDSGVIRPARPQTRQDINRFQALIRDCRNGHYDYLERDYRLGLDEFLAAVQKFVDRMIALGDVWDSDQKVMHRLKCWLKSWAGRLRRY